MSEFIDLTNKIFGRLTVMERVDNNKHGQTRFKCQCICGNTSIVLSRLLRNGTTTSCGCYHDEMSKINNTTHNMRHVSEYKIWLQMKNRCYNPNSYAHIHYGGRGIKVCERWRNSFELFYHDMGARPSMAHSIDRINTNGNYEPSNCRWATDFVQTRNTRTTKIKLEDISDIVNKYKSGRYTQDQLAIEYNCSQFNIHYTLKKYSGINIEKFLTEQGVTP